MNRVHVLPADVVSKIAAGEVIDRPASVIKELLENALDADADLIAINLTQAGKTSITVTDNGSGIRQDDMEVIFQRHSTSKIVKADDLFNIRSLGFRGEALYSICSVADIIVKSKPGEQDSGWEIHMRGGTRLNLKPIAMNRGTEITVTELFFNTPARRKFLKSDTSELNHILSLLIPYTLLYPQRRFLLTHNRKTVLDLQATEDVEQRIADVLNLDRRFFLNVQRSLPELSCDLHMILGDINISRSKRDMQFLFVNGRPVHSKNISFHLNDVFRLILPPRHYPFFAVSLTLPPQDLDVNIHPTKREIKIRDEQTLCSFLRRACEHALMNQSGPKAARDDDMTCQCVPKAKDPEEHQRPNARTMIQRALKERRAQELETEYVADSATAYRRPTEQYTIPLNPLDSARDVDQALFTQKPQSVKDRLTEARFAGSFSHKYLFFEFDKRLLILDQHAAQERIMFEHFVTQMQNSTIEVQNLLTPYLLKASPQDLLAWQDGKDRLAEIGFDTTQFDNETIAIQSHPVLINHPEQAVKELLAGRDIARCDHESIARRACRASVMAGDAMNAQQAEFQREQLLQCRNPLTCPHGRPTVIEMSLDFFDKQFLRT